MTEHESSRDAARIRPSEDVSDARSTETTSGPPTSPNDASPRRAAGDREAAGPPPDVEGSMAELLAAFERFRAGGPSPLPVNAPAQPDARSRPLGGPQPLAGRDGTWTIAVDGDELSGDRYVPVFPGSPLWTGALGEAGGPSSTLAEHSATPDVEVVMDDTSSPPWSDPFSAAAAFLQAGREFLRSGRKEDARRAFQSAIRESPDDELARSYLALAEDLHIRELCPGWAPSRVPRLAVSPQELSAIELDPALGAILSRFEKPMSFVEVEALFPQVDRVDLYRSLGRALSSGLIVLD